MLNLTDDQWWQRLNQYRQAQIQRDAVLWSYYDGTQPLVYVARILMEQGERFPPLRVPWPELVIDTTEERLDLLGWRLGDSDSTDDELDDVMADNDLPEKATEGHIASLVTSDAFVMLGPDGPGRSPLVTIEYSDQVAVELDPRTGRTIAALKVWRSDPLSAIEDQSILLLPGRQIDYENGKPVGETKTRWTKALERHQTSPIVPVVPLTNRPRRGRGRTELQAIMPFADAANQTATNMLAALEHHSLPRRWAVGLDEKDFVDKDGKQLPPWKIATGALWAVEREHPDDRIELGQFAAADLRNFHESYKLMALAAASHYGLPPHMIGYSTENPASADAIRASEARLIKRAERRQRTFGGGWERAMRVALAIMGRDPNEANRLESVWRDPATPTRTSMSSAARDLFTAGIIDRQQAQEDCGYSKAQRARMARDDPARLGGLLNDVRSLDVGGSGTGDVAVSAG